MDQGGARDTELDDHYTGLPSSRLRYAIRSAWQEVVESRATQTVQRPHTFDRSGKLPSRLTHEATNRTIELIDALSLKGDFIVAAIEIECTTPIYSGLLRMSDLWRCKMMLVEWRTDGVLPKKAICSSTLPPTTTTKLVIAFSAT